MEAVNLAPHDSPSVPDHDLSREEALHLLGIVRFGRLVFTVGALPEVRLVGHVRDGERLLLGLSRDPSVAQLLSHPAMALVIYEADLVDQATGRGWSVVATGRISLMEDHAEVERARKRLHAWPENSPELVVGFRPERISGRLAVREP